MPARKTTKIQTIIYLKNQNSYCCCCCSLVLSEKNDDRKSIMVAIVLAGWLVGLKPSFTPKRHEQIFDRDLKFICSSVCSFICLFIYFTVNNDFALRKWQLLKNKIHKPRLRQREREREQIEN